MPRIKEYSQEIGADGAIDGRRATPADGYAAGEFLGPALEKTADVVQDTLDRQEVSDVQAKLAQARAEWTIHLQERAQATAPGDPTFAPKFNEDFNKYLQTIEGGVQTKAGRLAFRKGASELSAHFVEKAGVYQAQQMGAKAKQDYLVSLDARRNELLSDPTQFDKLLQAAVNDIKDPSGVYAKMPAADRAALEIQTRKELALSAVQGLIQNGAPELAKRQLQGGQWNQYLDADKTAELVSKADVGIKAKDTEAERQRQLAEREKRDRQDEVLKGFLARVIDPKNNGGGLGDREVLSSKDLTAAQMQHVIDYKRARAKELAEGAENRRNPQAVRELLGQIIANGEDPNKVYTNDNINQAYRDRKISTPEWTFLTGQYDRYKDGSTNSFARDANSRMGAIEGQIRGSMFFSMAPEKAIDATNQMRYDFEQEVQRLKSEKKSPRSLLDPKSPDYFFSPEKTSTYFKPLKQEVADQAGAVRRGGSPTALPNQPAAPATPTYKDYDKLHPGDKYTDPQGNTRTKK